MPVQPGREIAMANKYFEFEVSLLGVELKVWRRFLIHQQSTFGDLHKAMKDLASFDKWAENRPATKGTNVIDLRKRLRSKKSKE